MAYEPSSPSSAKKADRSPQRAAHPTDTTPAQAIAEAWMRETREAQEKWRMADEKLREYFHGGRPSQRTRKAKM
ncbi:hypothetical protein FA95DRAFT_1558607 [Auriscalpium vulgare]|uniref:Uncharacterized protein n=1 Tax=Auriscalpium vulgare TaxID=40419 RepID=A0ACB8RVM2_9AGAM|nr:hypothetical protein FA95DRAFT_1558607 [Auriscalpium vulgare]